MDRGKMIPVIYTVGLSNSPSWKKSGSGHGGADRGTKTGLLSAFALSSVLAVNS